MNQNRIKLAVMTLFLSINAFAAFNIEFDLKNDKMKYGCHSVDAEFIITSSNTCPANNQCTYFWYFGDGESKVTNQATAMPHSFTKDGTFSVSLAVRDTAKHLLLDSISAVNIVSVFNPSEAEIDAKNIEGEDNDMPELSFLYRFTPDFESNHKGVWDFAWDFGDGFTSAEDTVEHTYASENLDGYNVILKTTLSSGNLSLSNTDIEKYGLDQCMYESSLLLKVKDTYFTNPNEPLSKRIAYQPNIFTPNGDGENDVFFLNTNGYDKFNFYVYNRWGSLIFQLENVVEIIWDGKNMSDEDVASGTYFYVVNSNKGDNRHEMKGSVTLFR